MTSGPIDLLEDPLLHLGCNCESSQTPTTTTMQLKLNIFGVFVYMMLELNELQKRFAAKKERRGLMSSR